MREDDDGEGTIDISIDMEDALDDFDGIADQHYYQHLYDRTVIEATEKGIPLDNLMSVDHIRWEFSVHVVGYYLRIDNCFQTELNKEETFWTLLSRAIKW